MAGDVRRYELPLALVVQHPHRPHVDVGHRFAELVDDAPADDAHAWKCEVDVLGGLARLELQRFARLARSPLAVPERQVAIAFGSKREAAGRQIANLEAAVAVRADGARRGQPGPGNQDARTAQRPVGLDARDAAADARRVLLVRRRGIARRRVAHGGRSHLRRGRERQRRSGQREENRRERAISGARGQAACFPHRRARGVQRAPSARRGTPDRSTGPRARSRGRSADSRRRAAP